MTPAGSRPFHIDLRQCCVDHFLVDASSLQDFRQFMCRGLIELRLVSTKSFADKQAR